MAARLAFYALNLFSPSWFDATVGLDDDLGGPILELKPTREPFPDSIFPPLND
jgi:hypothetical protein